MSEKKSIWKAPVGRTFRVVCLRANGRLGLVRLCGSFDEANLVAKTVADRHLAKLRYDRRFIAQDVKRPLRVFVERWVPDAPDFCGHWESLEDYRGAFAIEFFDRSPLNRQ